MANSKISGLPSAGALDGTETAPIVQAGATVSAAVSAIFGWLNLVRDAANTLALRNGTSAQTLNVYNTYTDASNYERGYIGFTGSSQFLIGTAKAGTGTARHVTFQSGGTDRWYINSTSGHFLCASDMAYDIGQPAASRARGVYAGFFATTISSQSGTSYSISTTDSDVIFTSASTVTVTLPTASSFTGREVWLKGTGGGAVNSASSNVVPLAGGSAAASILAATAGKWAKLKSDGTNWIIMAAN